MNNLELNGFNSNFGDFKIVSILSDYENKNKHHILQQQQNQDLQHQQNEKLQQLEKLMNIPYAQLSDEEQEKDRVVARALLQAITGQQ